jgi:hypothetical protein
MTTSTLHNLAAPVYSKRTWVCRNGLHRECLGDFFDGTDCTCSCHRPRRPDKQASPGIFARVSRALIRLRRN